MALIEIDGLPNLKMVIFHGYVSHNQMAIKISQLALHDLLSLLLCRIDRLGGSRGETE